MITICLLTSDTPSTDLDSEGVVTSHIGQQQSPVLAILRGEDTLGSPAAVRIPHDDLGAGLEGVALPGDQALDAHLDLLQVAQQALLVVLPLLHQEEALGVLAAGQLQADVQVIGEQVGEVLQGAGDFNYID